MGFAGQGGQEKFMVGASNLLAGETDAEPKAVDARLSEQIDARLGSEAG